MNSNNTVEERGDRHIALSILRESGISFDEGTSDFEIVCKSLNLFLAEYGRAVPYAQVSSLGEKVRYAETLVDSLNRTELGISIFAHQISGLDWRALKTALK